MLLSVIAVVLVFSLLVAVHELGHMVAAKLCGVAVPDFSIGMGPRLFGFKRGETEYNLRLFPFGGFCAMAGMGDDPADAPGAKIDSVGYPTHMLFEHKTGWQKAFILVAGPLMNIVMAVVIMLSMVFVGFPVNAVVVQSVEPGSPAAEAGLTPGDWVQQIDGEKVSDTTEFAGIIRRSADKPLAMVVQRGEEPVNLTVTPRVRDVEGYEDGQASIGVSYGPVFITTRVSLVQPKTVAYSSGLKIGDEVTHLNGERIYNGFELWFGLAAFDPDTLEPVDAAGNPLPEDVPPVELTVLRGGESFDISIPGDTTFISLGLQFHPVLEKLPPGQAIMRSLEDSAAMMVGILGAFKMLFTKAGAQAVSGPVGIMSMIGQSAQSGWYTFLQIVIIISFHLAVLNLLPLPALDGGRLVFIGLKGIGIRISQEREGWIHTVGFFMLIGLIVLVSVVDVASLVSGMRH